MKQMRHFYAHVAARSSVWNNCGLHGFPAANVFADAGIRPLPQSGTVPVKTLGNGGRGTGPLNGGRGTVPGVGLGVGTVPGVGLCLSCSVVHHEI